ncbi:hypothetical protein NE237_024339 [Protea cynaroides]|uniref:Mediator of RNA polymerase II transcription subunit 1 n=1 Tax=Protea cynaroides TaxID=273540 RepID=A0A9Q0K6R2_9MAGN|nr:hypothetical protein NE237_024339 [Protea cynaroides]
MERSEPTLVPEWLKGTGSLTGSASTAHHLSSSSLHSDDHTVTLHTRNRSSVSSGEYDSSRPNFSDRPSANYSRRSSSTNGSIHDKDISSYSRSYSSFARSHRDRDWDKDFLDLHDKDRSVMGDYRDRDYLDPLTNILTSRIEKDTLRRSQSMISGKRGEGLVRRVAADPNNGNNTSNYQSNSNGLLGGGTIVSSIHKAAFERDFPSLGAEERQAGADIGRVSSPGLSTAVQSLPIGSSAVIGGDSWTSALAEVPVIIGSNSMGLSSVQQSSPTASSTVVASTSAGLNMAETLAQAPSRARTAPQLSVETQRLEEFAIKQSRQLIPMTPSMPKTSVLSPSEKPKSKTSAVRTVESSMATKIGQQQLPSSHIVNHSLRGVVRSDVPKTSHGGKLLVLKAPREKNGVSPTAKDSSSPTNASRVTSNPLIVAPSATFAPPLRSSSNPKLGTAERKAPALSVIHGSSVEKRSTASQAQSRNDFFNLMRKKTSTNLSSAVPDTSPPVSSSVLEKSVDLVTETATTAVSPQCIDAPSSDPSVLEWSSQNGGDMTNNGVASESHRFSNNGDKHCDSNEVVYPDEEEAAFLRSLGWEENAGEEEGLTEEEINAFYKQYMKLKPSSKLCGGMQLPKLVSHVGNWEHAAASGLSSSGSESEA